MIENLQPYPKYKESGLPWLGCCPKHWSIRRMKNLFHERAHNYLKASGIEKALLFNFGAPSLEYKRLILSLRKSAQSADVMVDPQISQMGADCRKGGTA